MLKLPTADLKPSKKSKQEEEDFEAKFAGCIGSCKRFLNNDYDQSIGGTGFKSIL